MLAEATRNAQQRETAGLTFSLSDDRLSHAAGAFDFVHSFIVLQHIPVARGEHIIRQLVGKLAPGGVAALHVPIARRTTLLRSLVSTLRAKSKPIHLLVNLLQGRAWNEPLMQMNRYNLNALLHRDGIKRLAVELIEEGETPARISSLRPTPTRRRRSDGGLHRQLPVVAGDHISRDEVGVDARAAFGRARFVRAAPPPFLASADSASSSPLRRHGVRLRSPGERVSQDGCPNRVVRRWRSGQFERSKFEAATGLDAAPSDDVRPPNANRRIRPVRLELSNRRRL